MKKIFLAVSLLLAVMLFISINQASAFVLPDTGQTKCYDSAGIVIDCAGTGQDGAYNINPMSYADNGDGTVTDNNTGFMWQQGEYLNHYTWFYASGTYDAMWNLTSQSVCGSLSIGGYFDWRLPTIRELTSIVDYSKGYPQTAINTEYFPNAHATFFWSSTVSNYPYLGRAWFLGFSYGGFETVPIDPTYQYLYFVRCVRGEEYPEQSFVDNKNGTVTDNATALTWQQGEPESMTFIAALLYCEGISLGGNSDWRLPNIKELESLTDKTRYNPAIDTDFFPNAYASDYWSSTSRVPSLRDEFAWTVHFSTGKINMGTKNEGVTMPPYYYDYNHVRCVRGGNVANLSRSLSVSLNPQEGGTVTSVPEGLVCSGNTCTGSFPQGTEVTITASPNAGWLFVHWDDGTICSPENSKTVVMDGDKTLSAVFASAEKKAGAVVFIDGIQIVQILFPVWPANYSQYLVNSINDTFGNNNFITLFQKRRETITPFIWANTTWDTIGGVNRLKQLLKSWTDVAKITGGPLIIVSHSWGTVLAYIAISTSTDEDIHVDKLITLGSPLRSIDPIVQPYVGAWLVSFGLESFHRPSNVETWHNFWATCDPISASISMADKKGNHKVRTDIGDCGFIFDDDFCNNPSPIEAITDSTCHSAYFRDPVVWAEILLDATKK